MIALYLFIAASIIGCVGTVWMFPGFLKRISPEVKKKSGEIDSKFMEREYTTLFKKVALLHVPVVVLLIFGFIYIGPVLEGAVLVEENYFWIPLIATLAYCWRILHMAKQYTKKNKLAENGRNTVMASAFFLMGFADMAPVMNLAIMCMLIPY